MKLTFILLVLLNTMTLQAQDFNKKLDHLNKTCQNCLDKGEGSF